MPTIISVIREKKIYVNWLWFQILFSPILNQISKMLMLNPKNQFWAQKSDFGTWQIGIFGSNFVL